MVVQVGSYQLGATTASGAVHHVLAEMHLYANFEGKQFSLEITVIIVYENVWSTAIYVHITQSMCGRMCSVNVVEYIFLCFGSLLLHRTIHHSGLSACYDSIALSIHCYQTAVCVMLKTGIRIYETIDIGTYPPIHKQIAAISELYTDC